MRDENPLIVRLGWTKLIFSSILGARFALSTNSQSSAF